jgi:trigger factor
VEHSIKELESGKRELTLTATKEELKPHYDKAYNDVRKNINLPGFRRGKVPNHIIKNMYGAQLEQEAAQEAGNDFFGKYLDETGTELAGTPELHDIKLNKDGSVSYILQIELMPSVEVKDYQGLTINEPTYTVTDEDVQKQVESMCREYGAFEEAETVENEDYVIAYKKIELDGTTREPIEGAEFEEANADLHDSNVPASLKEAVVGKNKGETLEVWMPNPQNTSEDKLYKVEITSVDKSVPAIFDDEFAKERTNGKFESADDFKYDMQLKMQERWDQQSRQVVENNIIEKMVELHEDFDVPEDAVNRQATQMVRNMFMQMTQQEPKPEDIKPEFVEPYKPMAKKQVQWDIIRKAIAEKEDVQVDDYDLEEFFDEQLAMMGGGSDFDEESRKQMFAEFKKNPGIKDSILSKKIIDLIYDYAITTDVDFEGNPIEETIFGGEEETTEEEAPVAEAEATEE